MRQLWLDQWLQLAGVAARASDRAVRLGLAGGALVFVLPLVRQGAYPDERLPSRLRRPRKGRWAGRIGLVLFGLR
jgi:hypothetical protein